MTIRYDDITITVERGQAASNNMITWLTNNNIATTILTYSSEDVRDALHPLSTWFEDDQQNKIIFETAPVLTFDEVVWESEDGSDAYRKRKYATQTSDLPENFLTLAEKVS
tara:strand:- start:6158 stop:6490 length:333 start_codon:yes stop_codon:yes gene_type:complete